MQNMYVSYDSNPADFIRLFVLVRTDIPYEHQSVQAGHAALQYVLENPLTIPFNRDCHDRSREIRWEMGSVVSTAYSDEHEGQLFTWRNGTLIYLAVKDEAELLTWQQRLEDWGIKSSMFREPDWVEREIPTALACMGFKRDFGNLPLLKMPKGFFASHCNSEKLEIK